jgi:acetylornithine deacetylase/succinyl-diaminopimelate desuccinylase-like protein
MKKTGLLAVLCVFYFNFLCAYSFSQSEGEIDELYQKIEKNKNRHIAFLQQLIQAQKGGEEIEDCVAEIVKNDSWLKGQPPVFEWIFGSQGVELSVEHPLYRTVSSAIKGVIGKESFVNPLHSASDIRNPNLFSGIPTVGYGPLGGDLSQNGSLDEWVDVEHYVRAIKITAKAILEWGKAKSTKDSQKRT